MSEYQYYEFRALDRPLTAEQIDELRTISSRATITPTSFLNVYNYGDFRGDPLKLMQQYFDASVYITNWGTHEVIFRLPRRLLPPDAIRPYTAAESVDPHVLGDVVVLDITSQEEGGGYWEDGEGWLDRLIPLREELAGGDLRALYLGWLCGAELGMLEDDEIEPPVPPGLGRLSPALRSLVEYLRIDGDLLAVAADRSGQLQEATSATPEMERWIRQLPEEEKNAVLLRLLHGNEPHLHMDLQRRYREAREPVRLAPAESNGRRSVGELLEEAEKRAEARERAETERKARSRTAYLDDLSGKQEQTWRRVETLIEAKKAAEYDQAVTYLTDLRDLSAREGTSEQFQRQLRQLQTRHSGKRAFLDRVARAMLQA